MANESFVPVLDMELIQKKATESAMKGAMEAVEKYYSGYDSPFKKAIEAELNNKKLEGYKFELPDIVATINESLVNEITSIANEAIGKTFIPLVKKFLTRADSEINFSDILKKFVEVTDSKYDDCEIYLQKHQQYDWLEMKISNGERFYSLTLHSDYDSRGAEVTKYLFLSLPYEDNKYTPKMMLKVDGVSLEMPFVRDVLRDEFISFIARLVIARSKITIDTREFQEWMFPESDECHCH